MGQYYQVDFTFELACCDALLVKSSDPDFENRGGLGTFLLYLDIEGEPLVCYGACVFQNPETKCYLYRSKYGNWVIGKSLGKIKRGALVRSHESDEIKFTRNCPCLVENWQVLKEGKWAQDESVSVKIKRKKFSIVF
eukprot:TRINITY_DN26309_c0_g1_i1.p1 TRINITY_DN26309_c0_g1~~TRINITY_DN26309_c0_g1_i1.p1  ORF type:complete len:137 (-),score=19.21 TRINITY_DN26309_c0_g1_i1:299-709(-)